MGVFARSRGKARAARGWPTGVSCAVGFFAMAVCSVVTAVVFPAGETTARLFVLAVATGGYAALARNLPAALVTAVVGWMFFNSFMVDAYGELVWEGQGDVMRLALFAGTAVLGTFAGWATAGALAWSKTEASVPAPRRAPSDERSPRPSGK